MVECESEKTNTGPNALTKIEEHEEYETSETSCDDDLIKNINTIDTKLSDDECKGKETSKTDPSYIEFDPLKYAIEFFANYNSDSNQVCWPLVTSQG